MTGEDAPQALYLLLMLVLVASSLVATRLPVGKAAKMVLAWIAVFAVAFALFAFRDEFATLGQKLRSEATGAPIVTGESMTIPVSEDGHFWVEAKLNGHPARFMVDSGATITTVSRETARRAGLETGMRADVVQTANGTAVMPRSSAEVFTLGSIRREDLAVNINPNDGSNVLGMNFLSTLSAWGVEGRRLVLRS
ncbi:TIGR02281 family clan AA aspartic protease [Sphingomonas sp. GCM10030256]|uniref:retropepsin-like aspartic protease family protein n=1 Tax=Sphingomonas sp. GCM10030256 TaxID=3273427 RepID=UPI003611742D